VGRLALKSRHRVLCGDSTSEEDVARVMGGRQADLIWTDPPYGVNHIGGTKDPRRKTYRTGGVVHNDEKDGGELVSFVSSAIACIPRHKSTVLYVASPAGSNVREMVDAFNASGFEFRHTLVWVKSAFVFGRADYHYQHELILYGWGERHEWSGPRNLATVMEFPRGDKAIEHPTSKPVALVTGTAQNHPAAIMADPFLGSGTTLIAAEQLDRRCFGLEIEPRYCDVIVQRWQALTGEQAVHAETGEVFSD
jgi:DNA modification methylase